MKTYEHQVKVKRGSLIYQLHGILNDQYTFGKGRSRDFDKNSNGNGHGQLDRIYSESSWLTHKSKIHTFYKFLVENGVKHYDAITPDHVVDFLLEQEEHDKHYKTIASYQTAINHVLVGNGRTDHKHYSIHQLGINASKERRNNLLYKERAIPPEKYTDQVDFSKGTGLRRSELNDLSTKALFEVNNEYYVITVGKGGLGRRTMVNDAFKDKFKSLYADYIQHVDSIKEIPNNKEDILEHTKNGKDIFDIKIPTKYNMHIQRTKYAINRFNQLTESGRYKLENEQFEVNGFSGDKGLFREISRQMGHFRVDKELLSSYLRTE
jgi:site-specific recombinase XerC